jgi:hypothetical protein
MLRVRSRVIGGWLLGAGMLATAVGGACADKKGALMLAITTDMKAPKDVNAVAVSITTNGLVKASFIGRVTPQGDILLPGTLAIVEPDDKNAVIRIRVMAFQNQKPRVIRDVRTTAPPDGRTAMLRIPLNFVNDGKVAGSDLPAGLVPDPVPGTEGLSPSAGATSSSTPGTDAGAGAVGTKDLSPSGGDFDFMLNFQPKDCLNPQDETIINGECHDSYIDSASLPDFDAADLGDSTGQTGSCFDLAKCFAGAVGTGQASGATDGGATADAGGSDPGTAAPDAGPKPFKDFRPAAVAFDKTTCTIQLNGADPARLNIAIVTPDTGECVRAGECYVPIDRGAAGWQDDGAGRVQLPSYLCKFLDAKGLHLATSSDVCAAKLESNPICTPKAGDDAGIFPVADAGGDGGADTFAIPEDFPSAVAINGPILYFASQSRQGFVNLLDVAAKPSPIGNIATAGSAQLPWRFSAGPGGVALANGSTTGYVIDPGGAATPFQFPSNIIDVAALDTRFTWGTMQGQSMPSFYIAPPLPVFTAEIQVPRLTALAPTPFPNHVLYGDATGIVGLVQPQFMTLGAPSAAGGARVDGIVLTAGAGTSATGYALAANGIYTVSADGETGSTSTTRIVSDPTELMGISAGPSYFPRAMAPAPSCLVFSSNKGLEYIVEQGGTVTSRATLVTATAQQPILGVAVGPDPTRGGFAAYYTVFAQRNPSGAAGGGIYRVALPPQCSGAGGKDGGTGGDSGADAAPPPCSPASCPNGCCSPGLGCQAGTADKACGNFGNACQDCTAFASTCGVAAKMCN